MSDRVQATRPKDAATPLKYAAVKKIALQFPGTHEEWWRGTPWFIVGRKSFVLFFDGKWIMKLPPAQQMMLFEARPQIFAPMRAGRMVWSYVDVARLDAAELKDLLTAAWRMVTTKKVQAQYGLASTARKPVRPKPP